MAGQSFRDAELQGWNSKAGFWDDTLGSVTRRARPDPACACWTSLAASARWRLKRRGAAVIGMDFAPAMVAEAIRRHPEVEFRAGDAEAIPLADASRDAVTCSFGMLHMERPERVLAEIARVLRPGSGRLAMSAWCVDGEFLALVGQAVQAQGDMGVPLPAAPPIFRFADQGECRAALAAAGFAEPTFEILPLVWTCKSPDAALELLYRGTVRMHMLIAAQTAEVRPRIEQAILRGMERYKQDDDTS